MYVKPTDSLEHELLFLYYSLYNSLIKKNIVTLKAGQVK
jgi:hypothetical protein